MPTPVRITVGNETASGNRLEIFVQTGSLEPHLAGDFILQDGIHQIHTLCQGAA